MKPRNLTIYKTKGIVTKKYIHEFVKGSILYCFDIDGIKYQKPIDRNTWDKFNTGDIIDLTNYNTSSVWNENGNLKTTEN